MNKAEAYKLLSDELVTVRDLGIDDATELLSNTNEFTKQGPSGISYCVTINILGNALNGSIHDHNTLHFDLLEETLEF